jgi:TolB protein
MPARPWPTAHTPPFEDLKARGADAVVGGSVTTGSDGRYETRVRLSDVPKQASLGNPAYLHTGAQLRATAHRIADFIYEKLTGEPGVFSTRIAYVVKSTGRFELKIADADGSNDQAALASREPIISPAWSPDGSKLAYVSFEAKKPVVYVHDLASGRRHVAANFKGSNSAPAWSPDGKRLAVVLTKDGSSQLYIVNADGSGATRIATSSGIDTEPRWGRTASSSTSHPIAAAVHRSIASPILEAMPSGSPSKEATTSRRARRRTARAWPSLPATAAASSWR